MSMLQINRNTLKKLTHESSEIRLRTLEQISKKLERSLALKEKVDVKAVELCKQLIRWFGFSPIKRSAMVLQLLKQFLQTPEVGEDVVESLGVDRLRKELRKIQILLENQLPELKIIDEINEILMVHERNEGVKDRSDPYDIEQIISRTNHLGIDGDGDELCAERSDAEYEIAWSRPSTSDYISMKLLADILMDKNATVVELQNALLHLQLTMRDYPAEYFLQAPHIFRYLLEVYRGDGNYIETPRNDIASTMVEFLNVLEKRLLCRKKTLYFPSTQANELPTAHTPTQLRVSKALSDLLGVCAVHLQQTQRENKELTPRIWQIILQTLKVYEILNQKVDDYFFQTLLRVCMRLGQELHNAEKQTRWRLYQIQLLFILQDIVHNSVLCPHVGSAEVFKIFLRDYTLQYFYPVRFKNLQNIQWTGDDGVQENLHLIEMYKNSIKYAVNILTGLNASAEDIIQNGQKIVVILDIFQSKSLVDILFTKLLEGVPCYLSNSDTKTNAIQLLMSLLNVSFVSLKIFAYEKVMHFFKRHLGCLMNGESYVKECSNRSLLGAGILGMPLNTSMMIHFVHSSLEASEGAVRNICCQFLELLLQSTSLLEANCRHFARILVPALPILNCCTFSEKIMSLLMKLHHPDTKYLSYVALLQGNIAFLYHSDAERRSEALTRLVFTLNSLKGSEKYMPNLLHISDMLPNDICLQNTPREYHHIFSDKSIVRAEATASLNNLFQLLESPDVEPLIRKTTLMQINVLCANWHMTGELCNAGAYYLILQSLENAMQNSNCVDYPDSAIPAISILSKILLYDSSVRCELSETPNIYVLVLRSLMMFNHDIQIRQDASICLFLLIFAHYLIATENQLEGPKVLGSLKLPLNIHLQAALPLKTEIPGMVINMDSVFLSPGEEKQYSRFAISEALHNGLEAITQKVATKQSQLDIKEDLKLTTQDVRIARATQPGVLLKRLVKAASNATEHTSLIQACLMLQHQLLVPQLPHTFALDSETSHSLSVILMKYLQLQPSNTQDLELYEQLLDVSQTCMTIPVMSVVTGFITALHKDIHHAFITLLTQKEETPFFVYYKISKLLGALIHHHRDQFITVLSAVTSSAFFSSLFDLLMERCLQLFEQRDLQRVRCLLHIMVSLTKCHLDMPDKVLLYYCRRFLQLSLALKSFTQTGAQWHRDCLLSILQLQRQMQDGKINFRLTPGIVKYLSGLCGHTDVHIRILVWSILYTVSQTKPMSVAESTVSNSNTDCSGAKLLLKELAYLPGGFMACCLSTLLDSNEIIWVRQLAGQLFANLLSKHENVDQIELLLERHLFIRSAGDILTTHECVLSDQIQPEDLKTPNTRIATCELISSYTQIFIESSRLSPKFLDELCTRPFMFKLYEILKRPVLPSGQSSYCYIDMVADICRLYTLCHENNFVFLERTICRDPVWLDSFCKILFLYVAASCDAPKIISMLQLLMVLFKDTSALDHLSTKMIDYSAEFACLFQNALSIRQYAGSLQKCLLSVLSLLCFKADAIEGGDVSKNILMLLDGQHILVEQVREFEKETERGSRRSGKEKCAEEAQRTSTAISEHMCISLMRLFTHIYPVKACTFTTSPNECQQQVVETLALLLKVSSIAQDTAHNLKLHEEIVNMFKHFFEEFATTSCSTYVKRHGETKKLTIIRNLQLVFKFLLNWHSSPSMLIRDESLALEYSKIIIQIWPWLAHSGELKVTVLKTCAFLCERSLVMCKRFSTVNNTSFAHSVLQLTITLTTAETVRVKSSKTDCFPIISFGLRTIMNCCSCVEGRNVLNKARVMDVFDCLYPFNPKASRLKPDILNAWLEFWEIFSRYEEGAAVHHINALCSVINRTKSETRLLSLRILRNMTFLNGNRTTLLHSTDFIYTVNEVLSKPLDPMPGSMEEQLIVAVAVWQLISGGVKYAAMIRGTKLSKHLRLLRDSLKSTLEDEEEEEVAFGKKLLNVLETIFKIFGN